MLCSGFIGNQTVSKHYSELVGFDHALELSAAILRLGGATEGSIPGDLVTVDPSSLTGFLGEKVGANEG